MDPFIGEIRNFGFNFPPRGWLQCAGQLIAISQNTALFALLGTQYGGNGTTTFALPDLRGRAALGFGQGAGLSNYPIGTATGAESVTLLPAQLPAHTHPAAPATASVTGGKATSRTPQGNYFASAAPEQYGEAGDHGNTGNAVGGSATATGGGQPHENRMPYLATNYCIATAGIFPSRI